MRLRQKFSQGVDWPVAFWIGSIHVLCILLFALYFFTWKGVGLFFVLVFLTGCLGVCVGYHRYFTHRGFRTYGWVRYGLALLGQLSGEGSLLHWLFNHRVHHAESDKPGDPHSPHEFPGMLGVLWGHILWMLPKVDRQERQKQYEKWVPDLLREKMLRFLDRTYLLWHWLLGTTIFMVGWLGWDLFTATSLLVWGMFLRMAYVMHSTWLINSATHKWGYRNYETDDKSTNLAWVAWLTFGEGWHNNHHHAPTATNHGHRWWEFDPSYRVIQLLRFCGLAWEMKVWDCRTKGLITV